MDFGWKFYPGARGSLGESTKVLVGEEKIEAGIIGRERWELPCDKTLECIEREALNCGGF